MVDFERKCIAKLGCNSNGNNANFCNGTVNSSTANIISYNLNCSRESSIISEINRSNSKCNNRSKTLLRSNKIKPEVCVKDDLYINSNSRAGECQGTHSHSKNTTNMDNITTHNCSNSKKDNSSTCCKNLSSIRNVASLVCSSNNNYSIKKIATMDTSSDETFNLLHCINLDVINTVRRSCSNVKSLNISNADIIGCSDSSASTCNLDITILKDAYVHIISNPDSNITNNTNTYVAKTLADLNSDASPAESSSSSSTRVGDSTIAISDRSKQTNLNDKEKYYTSANSNIAEFCRNCDSCDVKPNSSCEKKEVISGINITRSVKSDTSYSGGKILSEGSSDKKNSLNHISSSKICKKESPHNTDCNNYDISSSHCNVFMNNVSGENLHVHDSKCWKSHVENILEVSTSDHPSTVNDSFYDLSSEIDFEDCIRSYRIDKSKKDIVASIRESNLSSNSVFCIYSEEKASKSLPSGTSSSEEVNESESEIRSKDEESLHVQTPVGGGCGKHNLNYPHELNVFHSVNKKLITCARCTGNCNDVNVQRTTESSKYIRTRSISEKIRRISSNSLEGNVASHNFTLNKCPMKKDIVNLQECKKENIVSLQSDVLLTDTNGKIANVDSRSGFPRNSCNGIQSSTKKSEIPMKPVHSKSDDNKDISSHNKMLNETTLKKQYCLKECFVKLSPIFVQDSRHLSKMYHKRNKESISKAKEDMKILSPESSSDNYKLRNCPLEEVGIKTESNGNSPKHSGKKPSQIMKRKSTFTSDVFAKQSKLPKVYLRRLEDENIVKNENVVDSLAIASLKFSSVRTLKKKYSALSKKNYFYNYKAECSWCHKKFTDQNDFATHLMTHGGKHVCSMCHRAFLFHLDLLRHLLTCVSC